MQILELSKMQLTETTTVEQIETQGGTTFAHDIGRCCRFLYKYISSGGHYLGTGVASADFIEKRIINSK